MWAMFQLFRIWNFTCDILYWKRIWPCGRDSDRNSLIHYWIKSASILVLDPACPTLKADVLLYFQLVVEFTWKERESKSAAALLLAQQQQFTLKERESKCAFTWFTWKDFKRESNCAAVLLLAQQTAAPCSIRPARCRMTCNPKPWKHSSPNGITQPHTADASADSPHSARGHKAKPTG